MIAVDRDPENLKQEWAWNAARADGLKASMPRHSNVEHQASRAVWRGSIEKIGNRRKLLGMQADGPQQTRNRVAKLGIVIDDQDAGVRVTHPRTLR